MNEPTATPAITMTPVTSSQIKAIGHDGATTLAIQFLSANGQTGATYHYANFTGDDFEKFRDAQISVGAYFAKHIKPHSFKHPFTKQPKPPTADSAD